MKQIKKLALFATVALGAMSCSNNEIIETLNEQNEIRFASVQMGNSIITRANETLNGTESFGVYAYVTQSNLNDYDYFINQKLSKTDASWGLDNKFFYPNGDFSMKFLAYGKKHNTVNGGSDLVPTTSGGATLTYTDWNVTTKGSDVCESFVVTKSPATVTKETKNTPIALTFTHALSKILFNANIITSTEFKNVTAKITSITINTAAKGTLTVGATNKWVPESTNSLQTITLAETANKLTPISTLVTSEYYVIPLENVADTKEIKVDVDVVHNYNDGTPSNIVVAKASATFNTTGAQLTMNNKVTYNLTVDLSKLIDPTNPDGLVEIKFAEPTIEDWTQVNGGDATLPEVTPQP